MVYCRENSSTSVEAAEGKREKGKDQGLLQTRKRRDTQMHCDLILESCEEMNEKRRSVKEKEMKIREGVSGMKSNI